MTSTPFSTWRSSTDQLDLSASTNNSSTLNGSSLASQSLDSLISDHSLSSALLSDHSLSSALSNNSFDIAALIQNASFLNSQYRSISAPATYRAPPRTGLSPPGINIPPSGGVNILHPHTSLPLLRLPPDYSIRGLTPPPSPTHPHYKKQDEVHLPSPKRQNSQPSPTMFDPLRGMVRPPSIRTQSPLGGAFSKCDNVSQPTSNGCSTNCSDGVEQDLPERTSR